MKPSQALRAHKDRVLAVLQRYGAKNPRVFGSSAQSLDREGSDLDLIVRFPEGTSLFDVSALRLELEDALGCPVHVVSEKALKSHRGDRILKESKNLR